MSDTPTLLNSFHNFTYPELTGTETQINLDEEQKKSARSSWGEISNGRGWSEEITRLLGYYIIEIKCIFYYSFTLLSRMLPFSQHSHFVVHRSHCKWKKKAVSRNSQFNPSPVTLDTDSVIRAGRERRSSVGTRSQLHTPLPQEYMALPWTALVSHRIIMPSLQRACRPNSAEIFSCMLQQKGKWCVLPTSLWLHLSSTVWWVRATETAQRHSGKSGNWS